MAYNNAHSGPCFLEETLQTQTSCGDENKIFLTAFRFVFTRLRKQMISELNWMENKDKLEGK